MVREVTTIRDALNAARRAVYALSPTTRENAAVKARLRRAAIKAEGLCILCGVKDMARNRQHCRECLKKKAACSARKRQEMRELSERLRNEP